MEINCGYGTEVSVNYIFSLYEEPAFFPRLYKLDCKYYYFIRLNV